MSRHGHAPGRADKDQRQHSRADRLAQGKTMEGQETKLKERRHADTEEGRCGSA